MCACACSVGPLKAQRRGFQPARILSFGQRVFSLSVSAYSLFRPARILSFGQGGACWRLAARRARRPIRIYVRARVRALACACACERVWRPGPGGRRLTAHDSRHLYSFLGPYMNSRGAAPSPAAQGSRRTREAAQRGATLSPRRPYPSRSRQAVSESVKTGRIRASQDRPYPSESRQAVSESVKTGSIRVGQDRPYPSRSRGGSACNWASLAEDRNGLPGRAGRARLVGCITGLRGRRSRIPITGVWRIRRIKEAPSQVAPWVPDKRPIPV